MLTYHRKYKHNYTIDKDANDEMAKKFRKIEEECGKVTIDPAKRVYEDLPSNYK